MVPTGRSSIVSATSFEYSQGALLGTDWTEQRTCWTRIDTKVWLLWAAKKAMKLFWQLTTIEDKSQKRWLSHTSRCSTLPFGQRLMTVSVSFCMHFVKGLLPAIGKGLSPIKNPGEEKNFFWRSACLCLAAGPSTAQRSISMGHTVANLLWLVILQIFVTELQHNLESDIGMVGCFLTLPCDKDFEQKSCGKLLEDAVSHCGFSLRWWRQ